MEGTSKPTTTLSEITRRNSPKDLASTLETSLTCEQAHENNENSTSTIAQDSIDYSKWTLETAQLYPIPCSLKNRNVLALRLLSIAEEKTIYSKEQVDELIQEIHKDNHFTSVRFLEYMIHLLQVQRAYLNLREEVKTYAKDTFKGETTSILSEFEKSVNHMVSQGDQDKNQVAREIVSGLDHFLLVLSRDLENQKNAL
jgi:hypothetical protein